MGRARLHHRIDKGVQQNIFINQKVIQILGVSKDLRRMASLMLRNNSRLEGNVTGELHNWVNSFSSNSSTFHSSCHSDVIWQFSCRRISQHQQANAFLVSLAVSDFLVGVYRCRCGSTIASLFVGGLLIPAAIILCIYVGVFSEARSLLQRNPHHLSAGRQSKGSLMGH